MRPAPWPAIVFMIAGLAMLFGYHYRIMKHHPPAWMLFMAVFLLFGGLFHWVRVLDNRICKLEEENATDRERGREESVPSGESRADA